MLNIYILILILILNVTHARTPCRYIAVTRSSHCFCL